MGDAAGWLWIPGLLAFALIAFGGALFYNEDQNPIERPDIASAQATAAAGTETTCTFTQDTTQPPRCRVEGNWSEYPRPELFCFCPASVVTGDNGVMSSAEVFLGPVDDTSTPPIENVSTPAAQQNWCNTQLARTTGTPPGWKNVITFDPTSEMAWACNLVISVAGEPCSTVQDSFYNDMEANAHCISNMMHGTNYAGHYACLANIISSNPVPCVRETNGRILVGTKEQLETQLQGHQDHYDSHELWMTSLAGGMLGSGVVILVLTLLCCAGQIAMSRPEDSRRYKRQGDEWSQDVSEEGSD